MGIDQQQRIVVLAKRCRADIADQQRHALSDAFVRSVGQKIMAFGGKTHTEQAAVQGKSVWAFDPNHPS